MKTKVLFNYYDGKVQDLVNEFPGKIGVIVGSKRKIPTIPSSVLVFKYPSFFSGEQPAGVCCDIDQLLEKILNDTQVHMLYDRDFLRFPSFKSTSIKVYEITSYALNCIDLLQKVQPEMIINGNMPHNVMTWIFCCVAEHVGVKVYFFEPSYVPWRYYLISGVIKPGVAVSKENKTYLDSWEFECYHNWIKLKRGAIDKSQPKYLENSLSNNDNKYLNLGREISRYWSRPDLVCNKVLCYREYLKRASKIEVLNSDVVFFLHYQPELSTLPRGYGFAQQIVALSLLAYSMPKGSRLLVKEHPGIFTELCSWKERRPSFYKTIATLPNTWLLGISSDTYDLIDKCGFVSTISGSVAMEAVIRGRKAVVFGRPGPYAIFSSPNLHRYENQEKLKRYLNGSLNRSLNDSVDDIDEWLNDLDAFTFSGLASGDVDADDLNTISHNYRDRSRNMWLDYLFDK